MILILNPFFAEKIVLNTKKTIYDNAFANAAPRLPNFGINKNDNPILASNVIPDI